MKSKKTETILYSTVGVAVMFGIIVAVNLITGVFKTRVDMTAEKLYTLSEGTKIILKSLDSPIEIRYYFSKSETRVPSQVRTYAQHVEDLISELQQAAKGKIEIKKFDPQPDTEAEESAQSDGIEGQMLQAGENFYLGLAISLDPQKVVVPLSPDREKLLEYDLARAIARVMNTNKAVVGVMSALPIFGQPMNPMMMRMGQQPQRPWFFVSELQRDFDVRQVPMETEKIEDDIKVLIVAHPKDIKDGAQYAIDQFVMRGGKLIAFLDAMSMIDSQKANPAMGMMPPTGGSSLDKLLKAWGVTFDTTKIAADLNFMRQLQGRDGRPQNVPTFLFLNTKGINTEDALTSQLDNVWLPFCGVFSGTPASDIKQTVLLKTTTESQVVEGMMAQFAGQKLVDDFKASGTAYPLAIRLAGKFKTAYPDGKPAAEKTDDKDEKKPEEKKEDSLKETKKENVVILVGDSDFLSDDICVQINPFFGVATPRNGNLNLAQNMVDQLAGDSNLVGARSRASLRRPFTVVQEMQADAQKRFQAEIKKVEEERDDAQKKLNELQAKKEGNQRFIISPEQQAEIAKFKQAELKAKKRLKVVRKDLRQEIDSLENRLKWANIAGMPALVTVVGLLLAFIRKQRTKAQ